MPLMVEAPAVRALRVDRVAVVRPAVRRSVRIPLARDHRLVTESTVMRAADTSTAARRAARVADVASSGTQMVSLAFVARPGMVGGMCTTRGR